MNPSWNWPGSRWWRVDLHCHSPMSYDFRNESDGGDPDWVGWVEAARNSGIHALAITDHNTAEAIQPLQEAAARVDNAPVLFPGVEVTAGDGCHLLLLMDPSREQQHIEALLTRLKIPVDERGKREAYSSYSVEHILDRCNEEVLVIGAHANSDAGLLEHDGQQRITKLGHPRLAAVEFHPEGNPDKSWIDGSIPEVGRTIPEVYSSDSHAVGAIGRRFTWVKMTNPNLDGLRLALLDGNDSLRTAFRNDNYDPNAHTNLAIEKITIENGKYLGRSEPIEVEFNPWLNAIIGGRGTGKSTLIDFCRKTLRREAELDDVDDSDDGPIRTFFDRRMSAPSRRSQEGLLTKDTSIEVVYRIDNTRFTLAWDKDGKIQPITRWNENIKVSEDGDIRERFPVRIYSQKQLFAIAQNPNALLAIIDDSPEVQGADLKRTLEKMENQYLALRAEARSHLLQATDLPNRKASLEDVQRKLEFLKGGQAQIFGKYRSRRRQDEAWRDILDISIQAIEAVEGSLEELSVPDLLSEADIKKESSGYKILVSVHSSLRKIIESLRLDITKRTEQTRQDIEKLRSGSDAKQWDEGLDHIYQSFQEASAQLTAEGISDPNDYPRLLEQETQYESEIDNLKEGRKNAASLETQAVELLKNYRALRRDLSNRRLRFLEGISSETIRIELDRYGNSNSLSGYLSDRLGMIDTFEKDRQEMVEKIHPPDNTIWNWKKLDEVVEELFHKVVSGRSFSWSVHDRRFEKALLKVLPESIDRLSLYCPEDALTVDFKDRPNADWQRIEHGSPGQQTAALLAFALSHGSEPIILDQPEDDLDNTLIYDLLVSRLRERKLNRQIIVVTHNPNIVVHGDTELVLSLEYAGGESRINCRGGLQESAVRDEICRIMEGGREAFESRYQRIITSRKGRAQ